MNADDFSGTYQQCDCFRVLQSSSIGSSPQFYEVLFFRLPAVIFVKQSCHHSFQDPNFSQVIATDEGSWLHLNVYMDLNLKETVKAIYPVSKIPLRYLCEDMLATTSVNFRVLLIRMWGVMIRGAAKGARCILCVSKRSSTLFLSLRGQSRSIRWGSTDKT